MENKIKIKGKTMECNINEEIFKQWQRLFKPDDIIELVHFTQKRPSTIKNAIYYGHVKRREMIDLINEYYLKISRNEEDIIEQLKKLK
ncbi:MAG TPA: hypothetical protein PKA54_04515 [Chitinophagaceae bacterium]|nr:MAG: hypothetical protein UZ11_BCD004000782 [Bacteroidetes bacterium OLB11]HMN32613.1 hypothetical protein [Chitinophagaceae bacterium]